METTNATAIDSRPFLWNPILMKRWWCIIIVAAVFSWHCTAPVELEFETDFEPKVVIHAKFVPDSTWTVLLGRSVVYTDSIDWDQQGITDASVRILDPHGSVEPLNHISQGLYQSPPGYTPKADTPYTIIVNARGLPEASSSSIARAVDATFVDIRELPAIDTTVHSFKISLQIEDQLGRDYYNLSVDHLQPLCRDEENDRWQIDQDGGGGAILRFVKFDSNFPAMRKSVSEVNDQSGFPSSETDFGYGGAYFSDQSFDGESKLIELEISLPRYESLAPLIQISVANLSQELWSYEEYRELETPFGANYFEETPKVIYSNVNGGLGVFGGIDYEYLQFDHLGDSWDIDELNVGSQFIQPCAQ